MGHQATERYGYCGVEGYDSSGRGPLEKGNLDPSGPAFGVISQPVRPYKIYPAQLQNNNLATSQDPSSLSVTLSAGTGVVATPLLIQGNNVNTYAITAQGANVIVGSDIPMIVERSVTVTGSGTTAFNVTVNGYDMYFQPVVCTFPGPSTPGGVQTTTESNKTFSYVTSVSVSTDPLVNITVGTGDTYGFPVVVGRFDHIVGLYWNDTDITSYIGFTPADTTSPTTPLTSNVRGKYKLQQVLSDGNTALTAYIWVPNPNNMNTAYGLIP